MRSLLALTRSAAIALLLLAGLGAAQAQGQWAGAEDARRR